MTATSYPQCVFNPENALEKPEGSKFFLGETVLHTGNQQMYTVCDLSNYESDYYGMWPVGYMAAVPKYGTYGRHLESISTTVEPLLLT